MGLGIWLRKALWVGFPRNVPLVPTPFWKTQEGSPKAPVFRIPVSLDPVSYSQVVWRSVLMSQVSVP